MQISYNGIQLLKKEEGFREEAYQDSGGVWTIGFGSTSIDGKPVEPGMVLSEAEADDEMRKFLAGVQTTINHYVKVPITQNMFDALCSFIYNIGIGAFLRSTMLKLLNAGLYQAAANQFARWRYDNGVEIPGLVNRRKREKELFLRK